MPGLKPHPGNGLDGIHGCCSSVFLVGSAIISGNWN
jgi:hypothetical protein